MAPGALEGVRGKRSAPSLANVSMDYDEHPDEDWVEDEGDEDDVLLACPSCRELVHEDTQQCPHCGDWITPVYPGSQAKRWIWTVVVVLLVISFLIWIIR